MTYDAIVVGGSYAGLSAALQLVRARRRVLVVDAGRPRNRFARTAHGFLGQDGRAPLDIQRDAARLVTAYPTAELVRGEAIAAYAVDGNFTVAVADAEGRVREAAARRLVLATGVTDELPPIPGMPERWGVTVLHCPYCHGYEVAGRPLGVIAAHALSAHAAALLPDWGPTTYFTQGAFEPDAEQAARLAARGVAVERSPVVELLGRAPALDAVRLADGRVVPLGAVFTAPRTRAASPLAAQLGCAFDEGPTGAYVRVDDLKRTPVPGVYAAGDAAAPMGNATLASAAGMTAGVSAHQSLALDVAERPRDVAGPTTRSTTHDRR